MSMRALLTATRNRIRTALSLTERNCEIMPDGQPPAFSGELYIAVHPGDFYNDSLTSLDETYSVYVTITRRADYSPHDRLGTQLLTHLDGLYGRAEAVRAIVHMDYSIINAANSIIGPLRNGFVEPLSFQNCTYLGVKGPDWFNAEGSDDTPTGLAVQLTFGGARRVQVIEEQA